MVLVCCVARLSVVMVLYVWWSVVTLWGGRFAVYGGSLRLTGFVAKPCLVICRYSGEVLTGSVFRPIVEILGPAGGCCGFVTAVSEATRSEFPGECYGTPRIV